MYKLIKNIKYETHKFMGYNVFGDSSMTFVHSKQHT